MNKNRIEAFSDGVIAIILTIMVLELKIPHTSDWTEVVALYPLFISYILSYFFITIYWVNHHHLLQTVSTLTSRILWKNAILLFFLSLIPWATAFMGENHFEKNTVILYTLLCFFSATAFSFLSKAVYEGGVSDGEIKKVLASTKPKQIISQIMYALAILFSFLYPQVSLLLIFLVSCVWFIPDKNLESILSKGSL